VEFQFSTSDGTATVVNGDYTPVSSTLFFGPANSQQVMCMEVFALSDLVVEQLETFIVELTATGNTPANVAFAPSLATVVINDNTSKHATTVM